MDVEEITSRLALRFGEQVTAWCVRVPALAAALATEWSLTLGEPLPAGASSVTLGCRLPDGAPAVLKLSPDRDFLAEQVSMLRWMSRSGRVPGVLAAHPDGVLMEAIEPGTAADELPQPPTVRQWSDLMAALHGVGVPPNPPRDLRARCEEFYARIGRRLTDPHIGARVSHATWTRAMDRCHRLLATESTRVLLHGDLHLGNVLDAGLTRGLVAIDPKACVGDPCFDAVDYLLDAAGHSADQNADQTADQNADQNAVADRCQALADTHGLDPDRLYAWCRAIAPVIAVSAVTIPDNEPAVTELLGLAR